MACSAALPLAGGWWTGRSLQTASMTRSEVVIRRGVTRKGFVVRVAFHAALEEWFA
ncbi:MAG TPA: hypothetical protein VND19_12565 [Acetobacteraceae bacterium]|nr:hypothetical protein [Acetobacteraceae bacterium]